MQQDHAICNYMVIFSCRKKNASIWTKKGEFTPFHSKCLVIFLKLFLYYEISEVLITGAQKGG